MKINLRWLEAYLGCKLEAKVLADQLTFAGLEVEGISFPANPFSKVVVAKIESLTPHPNADKLNICQVNVGSGDLLQIVCGAKNAKAGGKFPCALPGADLGGGMLIQKTKLRGVESHGMMCSGKELGLLSDIEGILPLPEDAPLGQDLREYLDLEDAIFEIKLTPNRGDCLSVRGLAREIVALSQSSASLPALPTPLENSDAGKAMVLEPRACPVYHICRMDHLHDKAQLPREIAERLQRCGMKLIHPVVDILNYVMLELGQPLHAFDAAKIQGSLVVRYATAGERLKLLNEETVTLRADTLVIADQQQALAMAGIMGGIDSSITAATTSVILESAFFDPLVIAGKARSYGLQTDAAYRFERGVDPTLAPRALARAVELIQEVYALTLLSPACGRGDKKLLPCSSPLPLAGEGRVRVREITLNLQQLWAVLGCQAMGDPAKLLERLGFEVLKADAEFLKVKVPSHRFDIHLPEDLMEEIARLIGYDHIPVEQIFAKVPMKNLHKNKDLSNHLKIILRDAGFHEAITYSFISEKLQALFDPRVQAVKLANPISSEMSVMRSRLWPGLMLALMHNQHRQQADIRLFELGQCFTSSEISGQRVKLGLLISGRRSPEQWAEQSEKVDFYDLKGEVQALFDLYQVEVEFTPGQDPGLHPGQTALMKVAGRTVGILGKLHPELQASLELSEPVYLAEMEAAVFGGGRQPEFQAFSKFPFVRRDLALLIHQSVTASALIATALRAGGKILKDCEVFDVYQGANIEATQKSIAIRLIFQENSRTLEDQEVNHSVEQVLTALKAEQGATQR